MANEAWTKTSTARIIRLVPETVHDISKETGLAVEQLMVMLANAEDWSLEYQFVLPGAH